MERPKCSSCGEGMIYSFAIRGNEFVCVPCGNAVPFLNGLERVEVEDTYDDKIQEKYEDDLRYLAFKKGGAFCGRCNKRGGNNCPQCKLPEKTTHWGTKR